MKKLVVAGAALALSAGSGVAQEATFDWSGAYIGAHAGYLSGLTEVTFPDRPNLYSHPDISGFVGGVYAGYNHQLPNNLVVGVDADVTYAQAHGTDFLRRTGGFANPNEALRSTLEWTAAVRGRVGYAMDRTLLYATGGIAFIDIKTGAAILGELDGETSETRTGWTVGAGIEYALTDRLIARGDYRFADFGTTHYPLDWVPGVIAADVKFKTHEFRIGIAYKF